MDFIKKGRTAMVQPMYNVYSVILFANKRASRLLNDV